MTTNKVSKTGKIELSTLEASKLKDLLILHDEIRSALVNEIPRLAVKLKGLLEMKRFQLEYQLATNSVNGLDKKLNIENDKGLTKAKRYLETFSEEYNGLESIQSAIEHVEKTRETILKAEDINELEKIDVLDIIGYGSIFLKDLLKNQKVVMDTLRTKVSVTVKQPFKNQKEIMKELKLKKKSDLVSEENYSQLVKNPRLTKKLIQYAENNNEAGSAINALIENYEFFGVNDEAVLPPLMQQYYQLLLEAESKSTLSDLKPKEIMQLLSNHEKAMQEFSKKWRQKPAELKSSFSRKYRKVCSQIEYGLENGISPKRREYLSMLYRNQLKVMSNLQGRGIWITLNDDETDSRIDNDIVQYESPEEFYSYLIKQDDSYIYSIFSYEGNGFKDHEGNIAHVLMLVESKRNPTKRPLLNAYYKLLTRKEVPQIEK